MTSKTHETPVRDSPATWRSNTFVQRWRAHLVCRLRELPSAQQPDLYAVALAIELRARESDGTRAVCSLSDVVDACPGLSERTATRRIGDLRRLGLITVTARGGGRAGKATTYALDLSTVATEAGDRGASSGRPTPAIPAATPATTPVTPATTPPASGPIPLPSVDIPTPAAALPAPSASGDQGRGQDQDYIDAVRRTHGHRYGRDAVQAAARRLQADPTIRDVGALLRSAAGEPHLVEAQRTLDRAAANRRHSERVAAEHRAAAATRRPAGTRFTLTRRTTAALMPRLDDLTWLALAAAAADDADELGRVLEQAVTARATMGAHHEPPPLEATA
jgi:hypothetical protein